MNDLKITSTTACPICSRIEVDKIRERAIKAERRLEILISAIEVKRDVLLEKVLWLSKNQIKS